MKKKIAVLAATMALAALAVTPAYAGEWKSNATGWWWQEDNGTYPVNTWKWLDGNKDGISECYHFNGAGYLDVNTVLADGQVDGNGAWIVNGVVQTKTNATSNAVLHDYYCGLESDCVISIAEELDEGAWTYLDNIVCIWQDEPQTGVDYLRDKFVGRLSEDSINRIIDKLTTTYPHTNTIPWRQIEGLY